MILGFLPLNIAAVLLFLFAVMGLMYWASRKVRPEKKSREKEKIYACGENISPGRLEVPYESFYRILIRMFGFESFKRWHSGDINDYLTWIITGMVMLIMVLVLTW